MNYDIHAGAILGFAGKFFAFLVSLVIASLPVTGTYIWWGRKKKARRKARTNSLPKVRKKELHAVTEQVH